MGTFTKSSSSRKAVACKYAWTREGIQTVAESTTLSTSNKYNGNATIAMDGSGCHAFREQ